MKITEALPCAVVVNEKEYPIFTGFKDWILFEKMMDDAEIAPEEKYALMADWYKGNIPEDYAAAVKGLLWFYSCGAESSGEETGKAPPKLYDFETDAALIYAAFRQAYGINIHTERLHWWAFIALVMGIPDSTRWGQIMSIRATDTSKMKGEEKRQHDNVKRIFSLADSGRVPKTLEQRDEEYINRLKKRRRKNDGI